MLLLALVVLAGCSSSIAARLANPAAAKCRTSLGDALQLVLLKVGETPADAEKVATDGVRDLTAAAELRAEPFSLSSPSGVQYGFFFEDDERRCLLRLVAMQKGPLQISDNLNYLATRPLAGCRCER